MIKVLIVYSDERCGCTRKRTFEVQKALNAYKKDEINIKVIFYDKIDKQIIKDNDIVIFQRLGANNGKMDTKHGKNVMKLIESCKNQVKFVYDLDDYVFHRQNGFPVEILKACHYGLAPNETMATKMREYTKNVHVIRTFIDLERFNDSAKFKRFNKDIINIGWISSGGFGIDLMEKIYPKLLLKYNQGVIIHFFSRQRNYMRKKYKEKLITTYDVITLKNMFSVMKCFDFVINPIDYNKMTFTPNLIDDDIDKKTDFVNCKSEIKYINCGAASIPIISSPTTSYAHAIRNEENGFLANDEDDWLKYIDLLVTNESIRKKIGEEARQDVLNNYSLKKAAENYHSFFNKILS